MIPSDEAVEFAGILCARLCHDLAGPAGAVMAGAELLSDAGEDTEAFHVLRSSAAAISARLKFMRSVFGPPQAIKVQAAFDLTRALLATSPGYELIWEKRDNASTLPGDVGRSLLLLLLVARDCLPRGGRICVTHCCVSPLNLSIRVESAWIDTAVADMVLSDDCDGKGVAAKTAPGQLLRALTHHVGGQFHVEGAAGHLCLSVR